MKTFGTPPSQSDRLIGGDPNLEIQVKELLADDLTALFLCTAEDDDVEIRHPSHELTGPVLNSRFWDDNKMGPRIALEVLQVSKEGYGLQCLANCCGVIRTNDGRVNTEYAWPISSARIPFRPF